MARLVFPQDPPRPFLPPPSTATPAAEVEIFPVSFPDHYATELRRSILGALANLFGVPYITIGGSYWLRESSWEKMI